MYRYMHTHLPNVYSPSQQFLQKKIKGFLIWDGAEEWWGEEAEKETYLVQNDDQKPSLNLIRRHLLYCTHMTNPFFFTKALRTLLYPFQFFLVLMFTSPSFPLALYKNTWLLL